MSDQLLSVHAPETNDTTTNRITARIESLLMDCHNAQFKSEKEVPKDGSFAVGQYPAYLDFLALQSGNFNLLLNDILDGSASTFMALWFLSQSHKILDEVGTDATKRLCSMIMIQLRTAASLPIFFQGKTMDSRSCPVETMGWYPLVDGHRLQAVIPDLIERVLPRDWKQSLSNFSDGDVWAWCMAIDSTTPRILRYCRPITDKRVYEPLLGSQYSCRDEKGRMLVSESSRRLHQMVHDGNDQAPYPIATFYSFGINNEKAPEIWALKVKEKEKQEISCVVTANILSSIPLVETLPVAYAPDFRATVDFIRKATHKALSDELSYQDKDSGLTVDSWQAYAYDYYTIPGAPLAYVIRAHKRILEIGRPDFLDECDGKLLDDQLLERCFDHICQLTREHLQEVSNRSYAALVYCFNAMMNLSWVKRELFDGELCRLALEVLLQDRNEAYRVEGTGPYHLIGCLWVSMGSICFVVPPLVEGLALYLLKNGQALPTDNCNSNSY